MNATQKSDYHTKRYVQEVFEKRLREEGFSCPNDKLLCWYRVTDHTIVNSIIFNSHWKALPVMLDIGYGIFPLFLEPVVSQHAAFIDRPLQDDRFVHQELKELHYRGRVIYAPYSDEIMVYAPDSDGGGIYTFDEKLLPIMDEIRTIEDAYLFHKNRRMSAPRIPSVNRLSPFGEISRSFVDMALYVDDAEVYPDCQRQAEQMVSLYTKLTRQLPMRKKYAIELDKWRMLQNALCGTNRGSYLEVLEQRKEENILFLNKKLGVSV